LIKEKIAKGPFKILSKTQHKLFIVSVLLIMHPPVSLIALLRSTKSSFKGTVHPKLKILPSFTHPHVVPNLYEFLSSVKCLITNILQNIFFSVQQRKETQTGAWGTFF